MGEEPGPHVRAGQQAAAEDQDLQEADRGGRGDRRLEPGQVPQGPAGAGGDRGPRQDGRGQTGCRIPLLNTAGHADHSTTDYETACWKYLTSPRAKFLVVDKPVISHVMNEK